MLLLPLQIVKHVTNWHSPNSRHIHSVHVHTERALVWLKISANQKQLKYSWLQGEHVNDCKQNVLRRMAFIITRKFWRLTFAHNQTECRPTIVWFYPSTASIYKHGRMYIVVYIQPHVFRDSRFHTLTTPPPPFLNKW